MQTAAFELVQELTVCSKYLKLGSAGDGLDCNVIGIVIVKDEHVSIATRRGYKKGTSLIGCNFACCFETGSIDLISLSGIGLDGIVDMMWCGELSLG